MQKRFEFYFDVVKIAYLISTLVIVVSSVMIWIHLWVAKQPLLVWADAGSIFFALLARLLHRKTGNDRLLFLLVTLTVFIVVLFPYVAMTQALKGDNLAFGLWLLFPPFVAFLLLGVRLGGWVSGVYAAAVLLYTAFGVGRFTDVPGFLSLATALTVFTTMAFLTEKSRTRSANRTARMLREKEMLLWEVNHRIKNNLNLISSLLGLQAHNHPQAAAVLADARGRIESIAAVHHMLYKEEDAGRIDLGRYLERLAAGMIQGCQNAHRSIALEIAAHGIALPPSQTMALGLLTNELLTNSCKHAFKDRGGSVRIGVEQTGLRVVYRYRDDGPGFAPGGGRGLGLGLVEMMADQLEGQLRVKTGGGADYTLEFSLPEGQ